MESLSQEINFSSLFFYLLCGSAGQAAWFTVNVIKQLTVWYLRRLSEKKQKPCFLLLCLEGGFLLLPPPPLGDIADMNQNLSKGFLIRLKVKTLIQRHPSERCC